MPSRADRRRAVREALGAVVLAALAFAPLPLRRDAGRAGREELPPPAVSERGGFVLRFAEIRWLEVAGGGGPSLLSLKAGIEGVASGLLLEDAPPVVEIADQDGADLSEDVRGAWVWLLPEPTVTVLLEPSRPVVRLSRLVLRLHPVEILDARTESITIDGFGDHGPFDAGPLRVRQVRAGPGRLTVVTEPPPGEYWDLRRISRECPVVEKHLLIKGWTMRLLEAVAADGARFRWSGGGVQYSGLNQGRFASVDPRTGEEAPYRLPVRIEFRFPAEIRTSEAVFRLADVPLPPR